MSRWLFNSVLKSREFKGKSRLLKMLRRGMRPYSAKMKAGFQMELDCFEYAQLYLAQFGETEPETMALLQSILSSGDTFVDVGAHVGFVSLIARKLVGPSGKVIAVEPQPYNCERILKNWEINGFTNLKLCIAAAGESDGKIELPQQSARDKSRLSLALPMPNALPLRFEVPLLSLHTLLSENRIDNVAVLKIDVEGYELNVLKGLGEKISCIQNIVFESLESIEARKEICEWLELRGFKVQTIDGREWRGCDKNILESNLFARK